MRKLIPLLLSAVTYLNLSCGIQNPPRREYNVLPDGVEGLVVASGNGQTDAVNAQLTEPLSVAAFNKHRQALTNAQVEFVLESGAVEIFTPTIVTDDDGIASTAARLGILAGASRVRATLLPDPDKDPYRTVYFDLNALRASASKLKVLQGKTDSTICADDVWVIKLTDDFGNGVPNAPITVEPTGFNIDNSPTVAELLTDGEGSVTFHVNGPTAKGTGTLKIEAPGDISGELTMNFNQKLQWTSNRGDYYELDHDEDGSVTFTLRNACGVLAGRSYWLRSGLDIHGATVPSDPSEPNGTTDSAGQKLIAVAGRPEGTYYYYGLLGKESGEEARFIQTIHWLPRP